MRGHVTCCDACQHAHAASKDSTASTAHFHVCVCTGSKNLYPSLMRNTMYGHIGTASSLSVGGQMLVCPWHHARVSDGKAELCIPKVFLLRTRLSRLFACHMLRVVVLHACTPFSSAVSICCYASITYMHTHTNTILMHAGICRWPAHVRAIRQTWLHQLQLRIRALLWVQL
jgi:hypothetical protein